jgi:hypothetical protein
MQTIALQPVRLVPRWSPAPRAPVLRPASLAQQPAAAPTPAAATVPPPLIDSALVAFLVDTVGALSTGMLAYGATYPGIAGAKTSRWAWFFGIASGILVFKGLADLSRIRER